MKRLPGQIATADITVHKRHGRKRTFQPRLMAELMEDSFDPAEMSAGYKRGMVLSVYKSKLKEIINPNKLKYCLNDLQYAIMTGRNKADYQHPILILHFKPGSIWIPELHRQRVRLKEMINERLKCDF